ncbi:hypothetical protein BS50DRAFT_197205 [Corynespora cassiicola Philippines]|uniref:Uncharacterized protein n=1 Tax=Corynespora cassiicola Philippines TaxID=1448308 RepID=A0A2T2N5R0_CORCC|nr:hypothetical protein BS50DRAFT_197205 [Corynespora cassiicola Philippines]
MLLSTSIKDPPAAMLLALHHPYLGPASCTPCPNLPNSGWPAPLGREPRAPFSSLRPGLRDPRTSPRQGFVKGFGGGGGGCVPWYAGDVQDCGLDVPTYGLVLWSHLVDYLGGGETPRDLFGGCLR